MSKKVIYTVGANLSGPIEVEHFVDGDTSKTKKQKKTKSSLQSVPKASKTKEISKRTCGHSQKDARMRKKNS